MSTTTEAGYTILETLTASQYEAKARAYAAFIEDLRDDDPEEWRDQVDDMIWILENCTAVVPDEEVA